MISQKDIQSLIADIDGILPQAGTRLPWSKPGDVALQRRVLERVRSYLVALQQNLTEAPEQRPVPTNPEQQVVVQQIVQAVTQEMDALRADLMQPLQADLEVLRQQRASLVQEIRELERTKQQTELANQRYTTQQQIISEFSQALINRCSESVRQQLSEILANWEARILNTASTSAAPASATPNQGIVGSVRSPQEVSDHLRQMQVQSDQLLISLDANQRTIFETLERNLQGYQESLSQGLEKMHRLGVQGEMLFTALVNRLAQQLGREASVILQSSLQLSEAVGQTNEATTSKTKPQTLLPTNAVSVTEQTPQPNSLPGTQTPIEPLQPVEQLPTEQESALASSEPSLEGSFLNNLNSEDWEIIEGLDFENLEVEPEENYDVETFIQLDIDPLASFPSVEDLKTPSPADPQDLDSLLSLLNETSTTSSRSVAAQAGAGEVVGLDAQKAAADLNLISDRRRKEIEDLYESLFGTDSLTNTAKPDASDFQALPQSDASEPQQAPTDWQMPRDDQNSNAQSATELSSQVEDVLFEGIADPAVEPTQAQLRDGSARQLPESWEALFFEDSVAHSPINIDFADEVQASSAFTNSLSNRESGSEQESIKSIAELTDLFEQMGLTHLLPTTVAKSLPATTAQRSQEQVSNTNSQVSRVEDNYIPASPEENLLATNELESAPGRDIRLNENTLQQLQQDLYSFEGSKNHNLQRQEAHSSPSHDFELPTVAADTAQANQDNQRFLMPDELLAEDWEDLGIEGWSEEGPRFQSLDIGTTTDSDTQQPAPGDTDDEEVSTAATQQQISDNSTLVAPESVESDFDPDLFPSEALELDEENAASLQPYPSGNYANRHDNSTEVFEAQAMLGEPVALEDEAFIEMISSPELEFDSDLFSEETLDSEHEDTASVQPYLSGSYANGHNNSTEAPEEREDTTNLSAQAAAERSRLEEAIAADETLLREDEPSNSMTQEEQRLDASNFEVDLHQPEALNPDQSDNEKKNNSN